MLNGELRTSVLIASYRRPDRLRDCLLSLARQSVAPDEVVVVWQGDDTETRLRAEEYRKSLRTTLQVVHSQEVGIVPAENAGLAHAYGDIILMIDDDAVANEDWVRFHVRHYEQPEVGAVGAPFINHSLDGTRYPERHAKTVGKITFFGRLVGNTFDHPTAWRVRAPIKAQHFSGGNMSLRRKAFGTFERALQPYWQFFEAEACLQVASNGYGLIFDFSNPVCHYPSNTVWDGCRTGDLKIKVFHAGYNHAFVLAKHSPVHLRLLRLMYLLGAGSRHTPGLLGFAMAVCRYGGIRRELGIFLNTLSWHIRGWRDGSKVRRLAGGANDSK